MSLRLSFIPPQNDCNPCTAIVPAQQPTRAHTVRSRIISWPSRAQVRLEFGNFFQISKIQISKLFEFRIKIEFSRTTRALRTFIRTPYPHPLFLRVTYVLSTTVRCMLHATGGSPL